MKLHEIKLEKDFAEAKCKCLKFFEIRFNDRDYQVGDLVRYSVPDDKTLNIYFSRRLFQIIYVTDFGQKDGYVVFSEKYYGLVGVLNNGCSN